MSQMFRSCPDCRAERQFEQYHSTPGACPDSPDGICPEWSCTVCGAALLVGWLPRQDKLAQVRDIRSRVA
ncbi:MAG TPA: hypothetical protein VH641_19495 [Streptosporangiaceae bacterium]|jgi:hypothetical protein